MFTLPSINQDFNVTRKAKKDNVSVNVVLTNAEQTGYSIRIKKFSERRHILPTAALFADMAAE